MVDIRLDEEQGYQLPVQIEKKPYFVRLVLATKIVSTDKQAGYVLLGTALVGIVASIIILFVSSSPPVQGGVPTPLAYRQPVIFPQ